MNDVGVVGQQVVEEVRDMVKHFAIRNELNDLLFIFLTDFLEKLEKKRENKAILIKIYFIVFPFDRVLYIIHIMLVRTDIHVVVQQFLQKQRGLVQITIIGQIDSIITTIAIVMQKSSPVLIEQLCGWVVRLGQGGEEGIDIILIVLVDIFLKCNEKQRIEKYTQLGDDRVVLTHIILHQGRIKVDHRINHLFGGCIIKTTQ